MVKLSPRLRARLARVPDIAREAAAEALEIEAQRVVDAMKAACPVDSGDLKASIGWTWGDPPPGSLVIREIRSGKGKGDQYATLSVKIYAGSKKAFYARFVEFGTATGSPAQPFFFPVWRDPATGKAKIRRRVAVAVRRRIREEFKNG